MTFPGAGTMSQEDRELRLPSVVPQMVAIVWPLFCFAFASANQIFLPEKYFADSEHIASLALLATGPSTDSFVTTAWIYQILGAFAYPQATQLATLGLFFLLIFCCASWRDISRFGLIEIVLFCFSGVEAAIYLAQYSKESIVVVVVLALATMPKIVLGDLFFLALTCGYAYLIRDYWYIVAALYVAFRLLLRSRKSSWIPAFVVIAMLCFAFGTYLILRVNLNSFRDAVAQTNSLYSQSAIQDYVPVNGPLGGAINALCTFILLVIPVPLVLNFAPLYLSFAGLITILWISVFSVVHKGTSRGWFVSDVRLARAVSLLLAMLTVQAVFEPDYGSYIKHLTPLLPLFFFALKAKRRDADANLSTSRPQRAIEHVGPCPAPK